ncbi:AMP deaminase [Lithohypha guttulata]|uniref:AMP deaminase n=1 Tax=Lithohypha guttulata TaxID=1690604 RepID=A0AAN7YIP8_9EURO|nr:AMP deaminase [Lithohypha guttulata]KAK5101312.1 AMP deaminase [Lithohypha guttulata]
MARLQDKEHEAAKLSRRKTIGDTGHTGDVRRNLDASSDNGASSGADNDDDEDDDDDDEDEAELHARHPYYNYALEKHDVSTDSKLFYQRHRMGTKGEQELGSPLLLSKSKTLPPGWLEGHSTMLGRSPSIKSNQSISGRQDPQRAPTINTRGEPFPSLQEQAVAHRENIQDFALAADMQARSHQNHPNLPHEYKDPLLANVNLHGAGAAIGVGSGAGGFAKTEGTVVSEVQGVCDKIKHILDLRRAYLKVSNQCPGDNPRDDESWDIYPPAPGPVWTDEKTRSAPQQDSTTSMSSSIHETQPKQNGESIARLKSTTSFVGSEKGPQSPSTRRRRKYGHDIGEDFDMDEVYIPGEANNGFTFELDKGSVFQVLDKKKNSIADVPTLRDYYSALDSIIDISSDGPAKSFAYRRLQYLEGRYNLYALLNEYEEVADTKKVPHRDFYNVRKVDTHVHHSACMNQKHLLRFIKSKMKKCPDEVVIDRDGQTLTLKEVFESINLTAYDLSIDTLDMHAHTDSFHRFDKFNLKYNPIGQSRLRDIFLKTDNFIKGRYLAEITREVIADLESSKYQMVEWRISIYGRNVKEWDTLAAWVVDNKLFSPNVRWLIQIPRLYSLYKSMKTVENFEQLIINIFQPLFEVTKDPSSHPKLYIFLQRVIGFDSVDDESKPERRFYKKYPTAKEWDTKQNPPYGYWIYYLFANMTSLNAWRKERGFNTFVLRPHCGEAGDTEHLASAILACHSISHGIMLRKVPLMQYIFYLDQIGVAMSPLSNNALFLTYDRNPFISYFKKGLNVSLSTDDPLQFAFTKEPLIEEYSVAAQIYKLSAVDMCELAKHSVDQCGFELQLKQWWLGKYCYLPGVLGNDVGKCNVPDLREAFRHETLKSEHAFIAKYTEDYSHFDRHTPVFPDPTQQDAPVTELYRSLESPRQYYATVADSIPDPRTARIPSSKSIQDLQSLDRQPSPLQRRASIIQPQVVGSDQHISASEPRVFPGLVHERHRRQSTRRRSQNGTDDGHGTGSEMSSSFHLEPAMMKMKIKEGKEASMESSD